MALTCNYAHFYSKVGCSFEHIYSGVNTHRIATQDNKEHKYLTAVLLKNELDKSYVVNLIWCQIVTLWEVSYENRNTYFKLFRGETNQNDCSGAAENIIS